MLPTICFDLDGVIATGSKEEVYSEKAGWAYEKCDPLLTNILIIRQLKSEGYTIVIYTARKQCDYDKTVLWLCRFGVPYNELRMDKPLADLYIDDNGIRFNRSDPLTLSRIKLYAQNSSNRVGFRR